MGDNGGEGRRGVLNGWIVGVASAVWTPSDGGVIRWKVHSSWVSTFCFLKEGGLGGLSGSRT